MRRNFSILFGVLCFCFLMLLPVSATANTPFVINDDNVGNRQDLHKNIREFSFIVLQVSHNNMTGDLSERLSKRAEEGAVIWFYDSSFAPCWGWKNAPMYLPKLKQKEMKAEFGTGKLTGGAVGAEAVKGSSVTIGVRRLVIFLPQLSKDTYSAVAPAENIIPLLIVPGQKSYAAAMQKKGKGYIIFKPLLWEKEFDGSVFQRRLINFSSR